MKRYRIGNDRKIKWTITRNGLPEDFHNRDITVLLINRVGIPVHIEYTIEGNVVTINFFGKDQKFKGKYQAVLIENQGAAGMVTIDQEDVIELVNFSAEEGGTDGDYIETEPTEINSDIGVSKQGMSAYEIDVRNGFQGSEQEWLESIHGKPVGPEDIIKDTDTVIIERDGVRYASNAAALQLYMNHGLTTKID